MRAYLTNWARSLNESFATLHHYLNQPGVSWRLAAVLLIIHTGLLAYSAYVHSPTLNEPAHLVAGLSHWKFGRFELYRVNPPLVRMVAALPVMAVGYEEDWSGFYEGPGARPVFGMGEDFIAANGKRSFFLFMIARWACIPFSWVGATVCYMWARDLYGKPAGLAACGLWCFSPNILAHASLITADAHAAALGLAACYTFWRWLRKPTWTQAACTGVLLGLAELAKTTLILFYALWPLLWAAYRWTDRGQMLAKDWRREAGMLLLRMLVGIYIVNLGYGFEGTLTPLKEFDFVSDIFTTGSNKHLDRNRTNRFKDTRIGDLAVPFPKNYLLGLDVQQRDFENYNWPSYLRGKWQDRGWWYYYLYAASIKAPLGILLLGGISCALLAWEALSIGGKPISRDVAILLIPAIVILLVVSSKTGFSEHFRYVLPCFPFAFIWITCHLRPKSPLDNMDLPGAGRSRDLVGPTAPQSDRAPLRSVCPVLVAVLLLWSTASSLFIYPHSLSYFNEIIGGPRNGPAHLLGSNVDWGQDLHYLADAVAELPRDLRTDVVFHGSVPPSLVLPVWFLQSTGILQTTDEENIGSKCWLAYSVNACYSKPKMLFGKTASAVGPLAWAACGAQSRAHPLTYSLRSLELSAGVP